MLLNKDSLGGLVFLCLSVAYGYYGLQIPLMPGDDELTFNAQTLPLVLAALGCLFSLCLIVSSRLSEASPLSILGYNLVIVLKLAGLIVAFAFALKWLGFVLSSVFFLLAGFYIVGERKLKLMLAVALGFALFMWLLLAKLLEVYLAPGFIVEHLFGA